MVTLTRPMNTQDYISISEIVVYSFYLIGGIYLCAKHGISRAAGFRFLVILALARLIGASMFLATLKDATNKSLYAGWAITNGIGLGPLVLMLIGLLSRLFDFINREGHVVIPARVSRAVQILMIVAIILLIIGGNESDYHMSGTTITVDYDAISRAGMAIIVVIMAAVVAGLALAVKYKTRIPAGEKRVLSAVGLAMPFVIVRLAYGCITILGNKHMNTWVYLGAGVIMEFIVCFIVEVVGFTLKKLPTQGRDTLTRGNEGFAGKLGTFRSSSNHS